MMIDIEAAFLNAELESNRPVYAQQPEAIVEHGCITEGVEEKNFYSVEKLCIVGMMSQSF